MAGMLSLIYRLFISQVRVRRVFVPVGLSFVLMGIIGQDTLHNSVSAQEHLIALGAYVEAHGASGTAAIEAYAKEVGKMPAVLWTVQNWGDANSQFPASRLDSFRTLGAFPMVNWQPSTGMAQGNTVQPDYSWTAIASGSHDTYITQWATAAKRYGHPLLVRMMHEMNGNWYPWALGVNGNTDPNEFVRAWRHIVEIFRQVGATNVQFVWCVTLSPDSSRIVSLYPGDAYVDWVSMDGYNAVPRQWTSLHDKFAPTYSTLENLSTKPFMITEVGSVENRFAGQSKADWILQGFLTAIPQSFPRIKAVLWFNKGLVAVDTSQESLQAFRRVVADPLYAGSLFTSTSPTPVGVPSPTAIPVSPAPSPSPVSIPASAQFRVVQARIQTTHRAEWKIKGKQLSRVHRKQRVTFAIYVQITRWPVRGRLTITWTIRQAKRLVLRHRASTVVRAGKVGRYWFHLDHQLSNIGKYSFNGSANIGGVSQSRATNFSVVP